MIETRTVRWLRGANDGGIGDRSLKYVGAPAGELGADNGFVTVGFLVGRFLWVPSRNKKCSRCGERTPLESEVCEHCGHVFHVR
jgi:hypothetical protein